jgi:hypothetical protein
MRGSLPENYTGKRKDFKKAGEEIFGARREAI